MFVLIDVTQLQKILKEVMGRCPLCGQHNKLILMKTYFCLRLFFIPVWTWHARYFIEDTVCGGSYEISEEDGVLLHYGKKTVEECQILQRMEATERRCSHCGRVLEQDFEYCPYCGQARK